MIAQKPFKVIVGIMLVVLLISASVMSSFASEDINVLDYPFYVLLHVSSDTSGSTASYPYIQPYREGNNFYFSSFPYMRGIQWSFYFTKAPQIPYNGIEVNSSLQPVSTSIPTTVSADYTIPIHIDSFQIRFTYFAERQVDTNTYVPVNSATVLNSYDASDINGTTSVVTFYNDNVGNNHVVYSERFPQYNPLVCEFYSLSGGFDSTHCSIATRLFNYPSWDSPFAVRLRVVIDEFVINGTTIAEDQIITEANNEMSSIYQRLSDYSLEHLTEVDLNDILNNVDNASNSVEDVRFLSIFDGIYGYGIIPTLITLSLCISFVGYLLFGKSG